MNLYKNHSDEELLFLIKQDLEEAFDELYQRYSSKVRAIAFSKLNDIETSREIVQDIFSDIWERRESLNILSFPNYISVAVKYRAINYIKRDITHRKYNDLYKAFVKISDESTLRSVQYNDLIDALQESVKKLPEKTQVVFRLNRFEGKSIPEIALKLNLSEKAIKYHISRSLKELRLYLKEFLLSLLLFCS